MFQVNLWVLLCCLLLGFDLIWWMVKYGWCSFLCLSRLLMLTVEWCSFQTNSSCCGEHSLCQLLKCPCPFFTPPMFCPQSMLVFCFYRYMDICVEDTSLNCENLQESLGFKQLKVKNFHELAIDQNSTKLSHYSNNFGSTFISLHW